MIPDISLQRKNWWLVIFISLFIGAITLKFSDCYVSPGLDAPFWWFFNYILAFDPSRLAHVFHSTGPLALLETPLPVGDHIIIGTLFQLLLFAFFTFLFISFYTRYRQESGIAVPAIISLIYLLTCTMTFAYLAIITISILQLKYYKIRWPVFAAIFITVIGMYVKTSLFSISLTIWLVFFISLLFKKEFRTAASFVSFGLIIYIILGFVFFRNAAGLINYTDNNIRMAFEYSDSSSLFPHNDWPALWLSLSSIVIIAIAYAKQPLGYLMALLSLAFFACWKHAVGREDFSHASDFFNILILAFVIAMAVQRKNILLFSFLFITSISAYNYNMKNLGFVSNYINLPSFTNFYNCIIRNHDYKNEMLAASNQACAPNILPPEWIKTIGTADVDVFPWDLSIIMINKLQYNVRPSLQSGLFGLRSDRLDADFINSGKSAAYIIWHETKSGNTSIDALDDEYLPNFCPNTFDAILANYHYTGLSTASFSLWQKRAVPLKCRHNKTDSVNIDWGQWVDLPKTDSSVMLRAIIDYRTSFMYSMQKFLYKGEPVFIEYETDNGRILHYRFLKHFAQQGLWANPLYQDEKYNLLHIKRIRFLNDKPVAFPGKIKIVWNLVNMAEKNRI